MRTTKLFVISCNDKDRYRIKRRTRDDHTMKEVVLERLGPEGWNFLESEYVGDELESEVVKRLLNRTVWMYGSPEPTRVILYNDNSPVYPDHFEERYGFDKKSEIFVDYKEVEVAEHE